MISLVRNRSAYGPLTDSWYQAYIEQYEKFPCTGLVGSTINLSGHPRRPSRDNPIHVQTYLYLNQWQHLKSLVSDYPGSKCRDRLDVIVEGEVGLSGRMMDRGLALSCLHWPDHNFKSLTRPDPSLPRDDIKAGAVGVPFRYKYRRDHRRPSALLRQLAWLGWLKMPWRLQGRALKAPTSVSGVRHLYIDGYD
jgi:hypothetical protein